VAQPDATAQLAYPTAVPRGEDIDLLYRRLRNDVWNGARVRGAMWPDISLRSMAREGGGTLARAITRLRQPFHDLARFYAEGAARVAIDTDRRIYADLAHRIEMLRSDLERVLVAIETAGDRAPAPRAVATVGVPGPRRRVLCVVQRYGRGGAEHLCQMVAERLATRHDVTVYTTCALSDRTWANELPAGAEVVNGVRVVRFPTARSRDPDAARVEVPQDPVAQRDADLAWLAAQGPHAPDLRDAIRRDAPAFDANLFFTYLYEPTVLGLQQASDRSILIPTAHDEDALRAATIVETFRAAHYLIFLTRAERELVVRTVQEISAPHAIASVGMGGIVTGDGARFRDRHGLGAETVFLYVGRVDAGKGCADLVHHWRASALPSSRLVLVGENRLGLSAEDGILPLGYVADDERADAYAGADVFVQPSALESLSLVLLEAWQYGLPALVNQRSAVLLDHVRQAQGGLYFADADDFGAIARYLIARPDERRRLGVNGATYVARQYTWERFDPIWDAAIEAVAPRRSQ